MSLEIFVNFHRQGRLTRLFIGQGAPPRFLLARPPHHAFHWLGRPTLLFIGQGAPPRFLLARAPHHTFHWLGHPTTLLISQGAPQSSFLLCLQHEEQKVLKKMLRDTIPLKHSEVQPLHISQGCSFKFTKISLFPEKDS